MTSPPPSLHTSPVPCGSDDSSTMLAADRAAAWLAQGRVASPAVVASAPPATRCSGTPAPPPAAPPAVSTTPYPAAPPAAPPAVGDTRRHMVRACSFERKVGQQRRGLNPDNSTRSKLQRSVSFGQKPRRRPSGSGEDALQLEPTVRHVAYAWEHGPYYTRYRGTHLRYIPISCSWRVALPRHEPLHTSQPPRHRSRYSEPGAFDEPSLEPCIAAAPVLTPPSVPACSPRAVSRTRASCGSARPSSSRRAPYPPYPPCRPCLPSVALNSHSTARDRPAPRPCSAPPASFELHL